MDAVLVSSAWRGPEECWSDNPTGVSELWFVGLSQFLLVKGKLGILATVKNGPPPFFLPLPILLLSARESIDLCVSEPREGSA